jgi:hypothetical protein
MNAKFFNQIAQAGITGDLRTQSYQKGIENLFIVGNTSK